MPTQNKTHTASPPPSPRTASSETIQTRHRCKHAATMSSPSQHQPSPTPMKNDAVARNRRFSGDSQLSIEPIQHVNTPDGSRNTNQCSCDDTPPSAPGPTSTSTPTRPTEHPYSANSAIAKWVFTAVYSWRSQAAFGSVLQGPYSHMCSAPPKRLQRLSEA